MIPNIEPYIFSDGVKFYWKQLEIQKQKQAKTGVVDPGGRAGATGGQQMNGVSDKIVELMKSAGVPESAIFVKHKKDLPGYYRPSKLWDIIVVSGKTLHAAIELKSQAGPSFGKNLNNRSEEAIGSSTDFWTAYREKAFADSPQPFLGYLFLLEDCPASQKARAVSEHHFPVISIFKGTSYAKRYEILCRRLVLERKYTSACLILGDGQKANLRDNYLEPAGDLSVNQFLSQLLTRLSMTDFSNEMSQTRLI